MKGMKKEPALSEVIGFLLIVALLSILFSMYLLYVVPLQGRDAEIAHMSDVKEQFTAVKMGIDSLIVNQQVNYRLQYLIPLGTGSGGASGALSILPMQSYATSSGELRLDTATASLGKLDILLNGTGIQSVLSSSGGNALQNFGTISDPLAPSDSTIVVDPQHFYLYYNVANPVTDSEILSINSENWSVSAQVVPKYDPTIVNITEDVKTAVIPMPYDLTLTVRKEGNTTMENVTVAEYVTTSNNPYTINLYDWSYGLADSLKETYSFNYTSSKFGFPVSQSKDFSIEQLAYSEMPTYVVKPLASFSGNDLTHPLQMFEYRSQNRYWVDQQYQYQWGATFVNQTGGTAIASLPPISIQRIGDVIQVEITDTNIMTHNENIPLVSISGSQDNPVQMTLTNLSSEMNGFELFDGQTNAKYLIINVRGFDGNEKNKWRNVFKLIADNAIRSSSGRLSDEKIVVTDKPLQGAGENDISLVIAWDGTPTFDLTTIVSNPGYLTLSDVIDAFNDPNPTNPNYIADSHLKIIYNRAKVAFSLYNLGQ